jgi:cation:H+ antiporter
MDVGVVVGVVFGIVVTLVGGLLFTNSMEYVGHRFRWTGSFTGAVVSPLFTSMPELIILIVALYLYGGVSGEEIGLGTILGEPFMTATVIFPVIFLVALLGYLTRRRNDLVLEVERALLIPYVVFTVLYPVTLVPVLLDLHGAKLLVSALLLSAYLAYTYIMYRSRSLLIEEAEEPYLLRLVRTRHGLLMGLVQLGLGVLLVMLGARFMVSAIDAASRQLSLSPLALSILIVPIATVLPESVTAVIWAYQGKDTLAVAALVGEKALYSTIYPALGLVITSWEIGFEGIVSIVLVEAASLLILYHVNKGRITWDVALVGLGGYVGYALFIT